MELPSASITGELKFAWWNTSLSPGGKAREVTSDFSVVTSVLNHLLDEINVDFCALGEVGEKDIQQIATLVKTKNLRVVNGILPAGRSNFSTCFLIKKDKLNFQFNGTEIVSVEKSNYKLAQKIYLSTIDQASSFHLYVSHWPSRLHVGAKEPIRATLGERLRQNIDSILTADINSNVVLMGDFNDEPFDASLSEHLRATRDRDFVREKKPTLLYNPFWRHLCHPTAVSGPFESRLKPESWGTYFHKNGNLFRWRTFDQMIFSSSFLGSGTWHLNEAKTHTIDIAPYTELVLSKKSSFDHLPILATLERKVHG